MKSISTPEPLSISYHLTESEWMQACYAHMAANNLRISTAIWQSVGVLAFGIAVWFFQLFPFWVPVTFCFIACLLLAVTIGAQFWWRQRYRASPKYASEISVTFAEQTMRVTNRGGTSELNWGLFQRYLETPDQMLLYVDKRNFSVIPKAAFPDSTTLGRFLDLVKVNLEPMLFK